jgi:hypothetical protein
MFLPDSPGIRLMANTKILETMLQKTILLKNYNIMYKDLINSKI